MGIDLRTKSVLVVDDTGAVRTVIGKMLTSLGITKIDLAADGDEALRRMSIRVYDIILCDYNLGDGRDGMQVLEEAKQRRLIGLTTVFAMITAETSASMVLGAVEYRPDDYLVKPITSQLLQERLPRLIARKEILIDIERLIRDGDLENALKVVATQLCEQPHRTLELMQIQVDLLLRLGRFEVAGEAIEAAASVREPLWMKLRRGEVCYHLGNYKEAAEIFATLIAENDVYTDAYDWLARVHQATGDFQQAKEILSAAVKISPRSILRARTLGEISVRVKDTVLAEQAYRNAMRLGRFSIYNDPNDSACLARILTEKGKPKEASKIIKDARKQYKNDVRANLALTISEASNCHQLDLSDAAMRLVNEAINIYQDVKDNLSVDLAIEFARLCHIYDYDLQSVGIITHVILCHVEDAAIMDRAREIFSMLGMEQIGGRFITDLWMKVAAINGNGMRLIQEGNLEDARVLLEKAASSMVFNPTTNINAARVLLMIMEKQGANDDLLKRVKKYLDAVPAVQANDDNFKRLLGLWSWLSGQLSA